MKLLPLAALLAAFSLPLAVSAQQAQQIPPPPSQPPYGQQQYGQPYGQQQNPGRGYGRLMRLLSSVNLSPQQQSQIQGIVGQYFQSHQPGQRDPQGRRAMMQQVFGLLTPDQQNQLRQAIEAQKAARMQQRQQQYPQQQYPQQPPAQPPA